jgi:hypothetical protein
MRKCSRVAASAHSTLLDQHSVEPAAAERSFALFQGSSCRSFALSDSFEAIWAELATSLESTAPDSGQAL